MEDEDEEDVPIGRDVNVLDDLPIARSCEVRETVARYFDATFLKRIRRFWGLIQKQHQMTDLEKYQAYRNHHLRPDCHTNPVRLGFPKNEFLAGPGTIDPRPCTYEEFVAHCEGDEEKAKVLWWTYEGIAIVNKAVRFFLRHGVDQKALRTFGDNNETLHAHDRWGKAVAHMFGCSREDSMVKDIASFHRIREECAMYGVRVEKLSLEAPIACEYYGAYMNDEMKQVLKKKREGMEQRSQEHRTIHIMLTDDAPAPTTGRSAPSSSSSAAKGKPKPRPKQRKQRPHQQQ